jgi:hypothetical protein
LREIRKARRKLRTSSKQQRKKEETNTANLSSIENILQNLRGNKISSGK